MQDKQDVIELLQKKAFKRALTSKLMSIIQDLKRLISIKEMDQIEGFILNEKSKTIQKLGQKRRKE